MMRTSILLFSAILSCQLCGSAIADTIPATVSGRTNSGPTPDINTHDSSKLPVRNSSSSGISNKAWIKFNIGSLPVGRLDTATLTVFLYSNRSGTDNSFDVSFVNDNYLDNIGWGEKDITWNNAPGNDTASQSGLDATKTTFLTTVTFADGVIGQGFVIDILPALKSDTDGIVQFVLHNSHNLIEFVTWDNTTMVAQRPIINYTLIPLGAKYPIPANKARVETTQPNLSWTNPDPNDGASKITCTVYLGADPNRPQMDKVTLPAGTTSVDLTAANFPRFAPLINNRQYYWLVDCFDPSKGAGKELIEGVMWSFFTDNNEPPTVNAGDDQAVWLGKSGTAGQEVVQLSGTATDDGLPEPATLKLLWTQVSNGAPTVTISPDNQANTTVTITARGTYEFTLTADDSIKQTTDTVRIVVGTNPCDASHLSTGAAYNAGDVNQDCVVNLEDFATLIAANWLNCTDTLTGCGK